jgi:membrane fusion protein, heavy metal efflux system
MKSIYSISIICIILLGSCHNHEEGDHDHADHEGHADHAGHDHAAEAAMQEPTEEKLSETEVELTQTQLDVMEIEIGSFESLDLRSGIKSNGTLELPPQNQASVSTMLAGRVTKINVHDGDYVRKGQALAYLEDPEFINLQEHYMTARSALNSVEKSYLRKKQLNADSISSAKDFEQAEAEYYGAMAKTKGLEQKLRLLNINTTDLMSGVFVSQIPVLSPISGYVQSIHVNTGKYVLPAEDMFEIIDTEQLHLDLMVYEKDISKVELDQRVVFSLSNYPDSLFTGEIYALGKTFENSPKAMVVHAHILNKTNRMLAGMFVEASIITTKSASLSLPKDAIVDDGGLHYIFILDQIHHDPAEDGFVFKKTEVKVIASELGYTQIALLSPQKEDARVVTKGAFYLSAQMKKGQGGGGGHGHAH